MKEMFPKLLKVLGKEYEYNQDGHKICDVQKQQDKQVEQQKNFFVSVVDYTKKAKGYIISDLSRIPSYIAKFMGHKKENEIER